MDHRVDETEASCPQCAAGHERLRRKRVLPLWQCVGLSAAMVLVAVGGDLLFSIGLGPVGLFCGGVPITLAVALVIVLAWAWRPWACAACGHRWR